MSPALAEIVARVVEKLIDLAASSRGLPDKIDVADLMSKRNRLRLHRLARLDRARRTVP